MDANSSADENALSDLERRLAGWRPSSANLDADAMLFAAGMAAGRRGRGRLLWPSLCLVVTLQAAGLGLWGISERAQRQALASLVREFHPERSPLSSAPALAQYLPPSASPDSYYNLRRRMERDPGRWLASLPPNESGVPQRPAQEPSIFRAGNPGRLFD